MSRWRILWAVLCVLLLWPVLWFTRYALDFVPGAGPQGGEAVALLAILYWMLWQVIATFHWIGLKRRGLARWWQRLGVALAPCAALVTALAWTNMEGPAVPGGIVILLVLGLSQLWALWRLDRG